MDLLCGEDSVNLSRLLPVEREDVFGVLPESFKLGFNPAKVVEDVVGNVCPFVVLLIQVFT